MQAERVVATTGCEEWKGAGGGGGEWSEHGAVSGDPADEMRGYLRETRSQSATQSVRSPSQVDCSDAAELSCSE
jgi:hypothetical protein